MRYAWIIDRDVLYEGGGFDETDVGIMGPRSAPDDLGERLKKGEGLRFRMKDGDGEVYYTGRIVFEGGEPKVTRYRPFEGYPSMPCTDSVPEEGFGPLDDFGMPNAGCTDIEYHETGPGGGWLAL